MFELPKSDKNSDKEFDVVARPVFLMKHLFSHNALHSQLMAPLPWQQAKGKPARQQQMMQPGVRSFTL